MKLPSSGQAAAQGGISIAAGGIAIAIAQIELSGHPGTSIWSNAWLLLALALAGTGLLLAVVFFVMSLFSREESKPGGVVTETTEAPEPDQTDVVWHSAPADQDGVVSALQVLPGAWMQSPTVVPAGISAPRVRTGPAFTGRWRHTSDGFEASPLMRMASLSMPGFTGARGEGPQIRVGACVACDPIPSGASSSVFSAELLEFLRRDPVSSLINLVINTAGGLAWTRQAGNGVLSLEAVFGPADGTPGASALLQPPVTGMRLYGRDEGIACLWLHIDPRGTGGSAAPKTGLAGWYQCFRLAIALTGAFADFLAQDLELQTSNDPASRAGVMIETVGPIGDLVDMGDLSPLPGAILASQFLGYAIADQAGGPADQAAGDLLRQFCDHTLHLGDFEGVLESILSGGVATPQPAPCPPQTVQRTWETRDLPVLRAIVKLLEEPGSFEVSVSQISDETGIDKMDVDRAIDALKGEYITEYQQFLSGGDPSNWAVRGVTPKARRTVGQWPDE
jgi:hypothetical protein